MPVRTLWHDAVLVFAFDPCSTSHYQSLGRLQVAVELHMHSNVMSSAPSHVHHRSRLMNAVDLVRRWT